MASSLRHPKLGLRDCIQGLSHWLGHDAKLDLEVAYGSGDPHEDERNSINGPNDLPEGVLVKDRQAQVSAPRNSHGGIFSHLDQTVNV